MRILVVDDNRDNRFLLEKIIKSQGYEVVGVANGSEALFQLRSARFDIIVSDIMMPVMDGFQLCRKCKEQDTLKDIPFVFYTATYTDEKDEELALKLGAAEFIRKPVEPSDLLQKIQAVLEKPTAGSMSSASPGSENEVETLKLYNERLVKKLEEKLLELENNKRQIQQTEADLKESEQHYRLLVENVPIALSIFQDGRIVFANNSTAEITGYTTGELKTINGFNLIHPDDQEKVRDYLVRRLTGKPAPAVYTIRIISKDGRIRWLERHAVAITWEKKAAILVLDNEITERQKAEEKIDRLNQMLRAIRNVNQLIVRERDASALIRKCSQTMTSTRGFSSVMIILVDEKMALIDVAENGLGLAFTPFKEYLQTGKLPPCCLESEKKAITFNIKKAGLCRDCPLGVQNLHLTSLCLPLNQDGTILGYMIVATRGNELFDGEEKDLLEELSSDIAFGLHNIRQEEKLRFSEERFRTMVNSIDDIVFTIDKDMHFSGGYGPWQRKTGSLPDGLIGREPVGIFGEGPSKIHLEYEKKALAGEFIMYDWEALIEGETRYYQTSLSPMRDRNNEIVGAIGVTRDISLRRKNEIEQSRLLEQSRLREIEISALLEGSNAIQGQHHFSQVARTLFNQCKSLTGATSGYVALLNKEGTENEVLFLDSGGLPCNVDPDLPMPVRGLRQQAYLLGRTVFDNSFAISEWAPLLPAGHVLLTNVLFAPLIIKNAAVGLIGLANKPGGFNEKDVRLVTAFSNLAAASLNNSRMWDDLVDNEEKYRKISTLTSDIAYSCIATASTGFAIDWMSGAVEKITGYTFPEIKARNCWRFLVIEEDLPKFEENVAVLRPGRTATCELRLRHKDGRTIWIVSKAECIQDEKVSDRLRLYGGISDISESKTSEIALSKSEQQFRWLFENMSQGVVYQNADGQIIGANPAAERILGLSIDQMNGRTSLDPRWKAVHEDGSQFPGSEHPAMIALKTGQPVKDVVMGVYHPLDNDYRWILVNAVPLFDQSNNHPYQVDTTFTDITQRLQQEKALEREHHKLANFASQVPGMLYQFHKQKDGQYCVPFTNEAIKDNFGCSPEDVKNTFKPIARVILKEDLPRVIASIEKSGLELTPWECEYRVRLPGKGIRTLWGRSIPEAQKDGTIMWYGFNTDITERKRAEEALRKSEERLKEAQSLGKIGNWEYELNNRQIWWSDEMYILHERDKSAGPPTYKELVADYYTDMQTKWPDMIKLITDTGKDFQTELNFKSASGAGRLFNSMVKPKKDPSGIIIGLFGTMQDITEQRQAQQKVIEAETLAASNRAKGELLSNVSHELRTPLASIKGFIETLLEPDVKWSKQQETEFLRQANIETDRLTALIKDLLDMSRIDSGKVQLDIQRYAMGEIVNSVSSVLSTLTVNHQLRVAIPPDLPPVLADKLRIGQVITNLVENATKFTPEGGLITIRAVLVERQVIVSVEDTGIGMESDVVENLFNRFYQAHQIVKGKTRGTGLGLAICKGLVEAHGGKMRVESRVGKGSIFSFYLSAG